MILILSALISFNAYASPFSKADLKKAKQLMIKQSISNYSGNCPCPFNLAKNGSRCGGRSAYSRKGGESPLCFEEQISDDEAEIFFKNKN